MPGEEQNKAPKNWHTAFEAVKKVAPFGKGKPEEPLNMNNAYRDDELVRASEREEPPPKTWKQLKAEEEKRGGKTAGPAFKSRLGEMGDKVGLHGPKAPADKGKAPAARGNPPADKTKAEPKWIEGAAAGETSLDQTTKQAAESGDLKKRNFVQHESKLSPKDPRKK